MTKQQKEALTVVAVRKNEANIITDFKLSDGRELTKEEAVNVCKEEGIEGVNVGRTRGEDHTEMLRANPTDYPSKALANLPALDCNQQQSR